MVRHLDKEDYGVYAIFFVIVMVSELSISAFVQNGFVKFFLDKNYDKSEVFSSSLTLNFGLTVVSTIIIFSTSGLIGDFYGHEELGVMLKIYCINAFLLIPYNQLYYYFNAEVDFKSIVFLSLLRFGSFFSAVVIVFFFFPNVDQIGFVKLQTLSVGVGAIISLIYVRKIKFQLFNFSRRVFMEIFHFGKYVFGVGITSTLTRNIDQLMIGYFISPSAVATYAITGKFMNFIEVPLTSIAHVTYPKFAETTNAENPRKERARIYEASVGTMLAIITPFILILFTFPSFFITVAAGEKYLDAVPILQILIVLSLLKPFGRQAGAVLEISGKPKIGFYALLITTFINVVLNYFLIQMNGPYGGVIGAVIASAISAVVFLIIVMWSIKKECNASVKNTFLKFAHTYKIGFDIVLNNLKQRKLI